MKKLSAGIDVGSTTVKMVVLNEKKQTLFAKYERHYSDIKTATKKFYLKLRKSSVINRSH